MENENNEVIIDSQENNEQVVETQDGSQIENQEPIIETQESVVEKPQETLEAKRARLARQLEQVDKKLGIKPEVKPVQKQQLGTMSSRDLLALMTAKVNEEDIDEVEDYAKYKGISVADALKLDTVQSMLRGKEDRRRIASATNVGASRRSNSKVSDESLISNARAGNIPDSDDEINRLIKAKAGYKQ